MFLLIIIIYIVMIKICFNKHIYLYESGWQVVTNSTFMFRFNWNLTEKPNWINCECFEARYFNGVKKLIKLSL